MSEHLFSMSEDTISLSELQSPICNAVLKQAFAIAKSGLIYDKTYRSTLVKN